MKRPKRKTIRQRKIDDMRDMIRLLAMGASGGDYEAADGECLDVDCLGRFARAVVVALAIPQDCYLLRPHCWDRWADPNDLAEHLVEAGFGYAGSVTP